MDTMSRNDARDEARRLAEQGRLIEAGFEAFAAMAIEQDGAMLDEELDGLRAVFFAGAKYLLTALDVMIDPATGPTPADNARLYSVGLELDRFIAEPPP